MTTFTKAKLNKAIAPLGIELVRNTQGGAYFYFAPLRDDTASVLNQPGIYVYKFEDQTPEQWRDNVANALATIQKDA